jgi:hypothetical protein
VASSGVGSGTERGTEGVVSIYASFCCMGEDEEIPAPLAYLQSHVLPSQGGYRCGSLDLGLIPGFVTDNGWCVLGVDHTSQMSTRGACTCEPLGELPAVWPYLRVAVSDDDEPGSVVVLDHAQVLALRDELTGWLARAVKP